MRSKLTWIGKMILRATHHLWNREISRIICRAYEDGLINSYQMHELARRFDPTQDHQISYVPEKARWKRSRAYVQTGKEE